jgi:methylmalonyl-CoA epimerase
MKIIGIEHIGIAVKNIREASSFWDHVLQIGHSTTEDIDDQGVITDIYDTGQGKVELLQAKYPDSPIAKFLDRRGPGIHHICLQVEDIDEAMRELKSEGIQLIGNGASIGAEGYRVVFIHPGSAGGVLVELAEKT